MKKYYIQPELEVSEMVANTIICASNGIGSGGNTSTLEPGAPEIIGA